VTATLLPSAEPGAPLRAARRTPLLVVLVVVLALILATVALAAHVVRGQTNEEARIEHHRGLALAAMPQLDRALQRVLRMPLAERPASTLPWLAGPQLGPGQPDILEQGSPTIETWLVRSTPDAVVAKMVIHSDGYQTTIVDEWSAGGGSNDSCGYSDLPGRWAGDNTAAICDALITSVPTSAR
jgi:hypothetical protein